MNMVKIIICSLFIDSRVSCSENAELNKKPDIIIIPAEEMGYSDLGCTGSEISTSNLINMAKNGTLFTFFTMTPFAILHKAILLFQPIGAKKVLF